MPRTHVLHLQKIKTHTVTQFVNQTQRIFVLNKAKIKKVQTQKTVTAEEVTELEMFQNVLNEMMQQIQTRSKGQGQLARTREPIKKTETPVSFAKRRSKAVLSRT